MAALAKSVLKTLGLMNSSIKHQYTISRLTVGMRFQSILANSNHDEAIFGSEHEEMRRSLRKIIDTDINPYMDEWEAKKMFPAHQVFKKLGSAGFLGITRPTEYGGLGLDYSYTVAFAEELGFINGGGVPMAIGVQTDMATPALARFGTEELKQQYLVPAITGDMVCCIGVSESGSGSDVASIRTKAEKRGGDYIINGSKMWITNSVQADWICLLCNTGEGPVHRNKSLIVVPMSAPGVTVARNIGKLGNHCSDTGELYFEDVRVPQSHLIGEEGMGFMYQMIQFQEERLFGAIASVVPMQRAIEQTIEYTQTRQAFGQPLINNQVIHFTLAELETEIEALRSMNYRAAEMFMRGEDVTKLASMCKLKAGRLSRDVADKCLQFWGGMGYTAEAAIGRFMRDSRLLSIGGGADEIMLAIICKYMGTLPKAQKKA